MPPLSCHILDNRRDERSGDGDHVRDGDFQRAAGAAMTIMLFLHAADVLDLDPYDGGRFRQRILDQIPFAAFRAAIA